MKTWVLRAFENPAEEAKPVRQSALRGRVVTEAAHFDLLQAPEKMVWTLQSLLHGTGLLSWVKSHFIKKDAGFFTRLAAFEPGPQSGYLYFLTHSRFLGKYGESPAKKSSPCWHLPGIAI